MFSLIGQFCPVRWLRQAVAGSLFHQSFQVQKLFNSFPDCCARRLSSLAPNFSGEFADVFGSLQGDVVEYDFVHFVFLGCGFYEVARGYDAVEGFQRLAVEGCSQLQLLKKIYNLRILLALGEDSFQIVESVDYPVQFLVERLERVFNIRQSQSNLISNRTENMAFAHEQSNFNSVST
jgi:hypothetical protein